MKYSPSGNVRICDKTFVAERKFSLDGKIHWRAVDGVTLFKSDTPRLVDPDLLKETLMRGI
jgi:hypothetical protein